MTHLPSLGDYDMSNFDDYEVMQNGGSGGAFPEPPPVRFSSPPRPWIGSADCWCGERYGHDWPGKTDGAPHPRWQ